jgi:hypothetical protein
VSLLWPCAACADGKARAVLKKAVPANAKQLEAMVSNFFNPLSLTPKAWFTADEFK